VCVNPVEGFAIGIVAESPKWVGLWADGLAADSPGRRHCPSTSSPREPIKGSPEELRLRVDH